MTTIHKVKTQLTGAKFTALMKRKGTNKFRIAKSTGISYPTLSNWEAGRQWPKDEKAEIVGRYLGLIYYSEEVAKLRKQAREIQDKLEKLK